MAVSSGASKVAAAVAPTGTSTTGTSTTSSIRAHLPLIAFAALAGAAIFYLWRELQKARQALVSSPKATAQLPAPRAQHPAAPHEFNYPPGTGEYDSDSDSEAEFTHLRGPAPPRTPHNSQANLQDGQEAVEIKREPVGAPGINVTPEPEEAWEEGDAVNDAVNDAVSDAAKPKPRRRTPRV